MIIRSVMKVKFPEGGKSSWPELIAGSLTKDFRRVSPARTTNSLFLSPSQAQCGDVKLVKCEKQFLW